VTWSFTECKPKKVTASIAGAAAVDDDENDAEAVRGLAGVDGSGCLG
jgi:hypothetical protein